MIALVRKEITDALRSRWVAAYAGILAILGFAVAWIGMRDGAVIALQMFGRTTATLTNLSLMIAPLVALVTGAASIAAERERGTLEQLLAQPIERHELLLAKYTALLLALGGATLAGFLPAGIIIARHSGASALMRYGIFPLIAILVIASMTAIGMLASVIGRNAVQAQGFAIAVWFLFVLLYDLLLIGTLATGGIPTPALGALLLFNPIDAARVLVVLALEPDLYVLGPAGVFLMSLFSRATASLLITVVLILWAAAPLAIAIRCFRLPVKRRRAAWNFRRAESMKRWIAAASVLLLLVPLGACGPGKDIAEIDDMDGEDGEVVEAPAKPAVSAMQKAKADPAKLVAQGGEIYRTNCAPCHGPGGKGDGPASANLDPKPRDHTNAVYMDTLADDDLRKTIKFGGAIKGMSGMPSHPHLDDQQLTAVVTFVRSLSKEQAAGTQAAVPAPAATEVAIR